MSALCHLSNTRFDFLVKRHRFWENQPTANATRLCLPEPKPDTRLELPYSKRDGYQRQPSLSLERYPNHLQKVKYRALPISPRIVICLVRPGALGCAYACLCAGWVSVVT